MIGRWQVLVASPPARWPIFPVPANKPGTVQRIGYQLAGPNVPGSVRQTHLDWHAQ
jgi:hypothetical protein